MEFVLKYIGFILLIFFCTRISRQVVLKKTKVKLDLLTDISMLLSVVKGIRDGTCRGIYKSDFDKNKESSYLNYWVVDNLYGWTVSKKFLPGIFKWVGDISLFSKYLYRNLLKVFLKLIFKFLKKYVIFRMIYQFCLKKWKLL